MQANFLKLKMGNLSAFGINLLGLENKQYEFEYLIDSSFFSNFEYSQVTKGSLKCKAILEKTSSFIRINFFIEGWVELICDRSLDPFNYNIKKTGQVIYKFGDEEMEIDDEVSIIERGRQHINLSQPIYEFISVSVPMKKLHPRFKQQEEEPDEIVYTTEKYNEEKEENPVSIDPRWETLKKLKKSKE